MLPAIAEGLERVICLSTDKAVYPINAMGMSKALMEKTSQAAARELGRDAATTISCVRYGNVAWSTASVLTAWRKDLKRAGVIETTGPEMFRYFFTCDEALELVCTAYENAEALHGRVLSRAQILDHVWNYDFDGDASVVETYVSYLRRKLDQMPPKLIHTVRGVGYCVRVDG